MIMITSIAVIASIIIFLLSFAFSFYLIALIYKKFIIEKFKTPLSRSAVLILAYLLLVIILMIASIIAGFVIASIIVLFIIIINKYILQV